jgi:ribosomal protein S18 acetylase RimI-like enzyme
MTVESAVQARPVAAGEVEEFLDWFERYWQELETFSDYPDPYSREEYRRLVQTSDDHYFWWGERDGERIGFCVFTIGPHWYRQDLTDGYVDEFYIAPEHRRGGTGRALATLMLAEFGRRKVREAHLSVQLRNERAAAFWSSLGFGRMMYKDALPYDADGLPNPQHGK